ncbi:MAG: hypothetical protein AAF797_14475 [Planctomycetota bacterium]
MKRSLALSLGRAVLPRGPVLAVAAVLAMVGFGVAPSVEAEAKHDLLRGHLDFPKPRVIHHHGLQSRAVLHHRPRTLHRPIDRIGVGVHSRLVPLHTQRFGHSPRLQTYRSFDRRAVIQTRTLRREFGSLQSLEIKRSVKLGPVYKPVHKPVFRHRTFGTRSHRFGHHAFHRSFHRSSHHFGHHPHRFHRPHRSRH